MNYKFKKKKIKVILIFFIICAIFIFFESSKMETMIEKIKIQSFGNPIDETGLINNQYFYISNNEKNAKQTTDGINKAIKYAYKNNINYIKLEKGTYLIDGKENNDAINEGNTKKGIIMESNIVLDLNGAALKQERNSKKNYANISITDVENVVIMNGILIGDKDTHDYDKINSSHEWGFGIDIRSSKNVKVQNVEIYNMTGDGIFLMSYYRTNNITTNVEITSCSIHDCRRQGISIIHGKNISINNSEIRNIQGTKPEMAIDIEPEDSSQYVKNVSIKNNKLYNGIAMQRNTESIDIEKNEIFNSEVKSYQIKDNIKIKKNKLNNANINMRLNTRNQEKVEISENEVEDGEIYLANIENLKLNQNVVKNNRIVIVSCSGAVYENKMETEKEKEFGICLTILSGDTDNHLIYNLNNDIGDLYKTKILNYNPYAIKENKDSIELNNFLKKFM